MLPLKRGRPSMSMISERARIINLTKETIDTERLSYETKQSEYLKNDYTQKFRTLVMRVIKELNLNPQEANKPVLDIFEATIKKLMISEIELVSFFIIFRQKSFYIEIPLFEERVKLGFFAVKCLLENDFSLLSYIRKKMKNEIQNLEEKEKIFNQKALSSKEIIKTYETLTNFKETTINYSYYVDDILKSSMPYKIEKKIFKITKRVKKVVDEPKNLEVLEEPEFSVHDQNEEIGSELAEDLSEFGISTLIPMSKVEFNCLNEGFVKSSDFESEANSLCNMSPKLDENEDDFIII